MKNLLLTTFLIILSYAFELKTIDFSGYYKWSPYGQPGNELSCPDSCKSAEDESCCACQAKRCWEINATACGVEIGQLYLEYTDIFGNAVVVADPVVNATFYELVYPKARLKAVPENICAWANQTVKVDLSNNRITNISTLKCMVILDTLRLDHNSITSIDNQTFSKMKHLRILSLSNNRMQTLEVNALAIKNGNILSVDLSWNLFESVDMSNVFRNGSFCSLSYEGGTIDRLTNTHEIGVTSGTEFGPGYINLAHTRMTSFINFSHLNLGNFRDLPNYFKGNIDMDSSHIICDCALYEPFEGIGRSIFNLFGNTLSNFTCRVPESMKGFNLSQIYEGDNINRLVCDLKTDCPRFCQCIDTPSEGKIVVNCSGRGLDQLPSDMPIGVWNNYKVDLLIDHNNIGRIENRNYIHRLVNLDMTENPVERIDERFVQDMSTELTIGIKHQVLNYLPRNLETKDPRKFVFGRNPILCDCDNAWIGGWMRRHDAKDILTCFVDGSMIDSAIISTDFLGCEPNEIGINPVTIASLPALVLIAFLLLTLATYYYRYEMLLLKRKYFTRQQEENGDLSYDVFLSFCEDNNDVFSWIRLSLIDTLQDANYVVFCPWFSIPPGQNREPVIAKKARKSKHLVVCLCDKYQKDVNSVMDFNIIWKIFLSDASKNIAIINFAPLRKRSIQDRRIRAFRNIRDDLSFKYTERTLLSRLMDRLGQPRGNAAAEPNHATGSCTEYGIKCNKLRNKHHAVTKDTERCTARHVVHNLSFKDIDINRLQNRLEPSQTNAAAEPNNATELGNHIKYRAELKVDADKCRECHVARIPSTTKNVSGELHHGHSAYTYMYRKSYIRAEHNLAPNKRTPKPLELVHNSKQRNSNIDESGGRKLIALGIETIQINLSSNLNREIKQDINEQTNGGYAEV